MTTLWWWIGSPDTRGLQSCRTFPAMLLFANFNHGFCHLGSPEQSRWTGGGGNFRPSSKGFVPKLIAGPGRKGQPRKFHFQICCLEKYGKAGPEGPQHPLLWQECLPEVAWNLWQVPPTEECLGKQVWQVATPEGWWESLDAGPLWKVALHGRIIEIRDLGHPYIVELEDGRHFLRNRKFLWKCYLLFVMNLWLHLVFHLGIHFQFAFGTIFARFVWSCWGMIDTSTPTSVVTSQVSPYSAKKEETVTSSDYVTSGKKPSCENTRKRVLILIVVLYSHKGGINVHWMASAVGVNTVTT